MKTTAITVAGSVVLFAGCTAGQGGGSALSAGNTAASDASSGTAGDTAGADTHSDPDGPGTQGGDESGSSGGDGGIPDPTSGGSPSDACTVGAGQLDAQCHANDAATATVFEPSIQWEFEAQDCTEDWGDWGAGSSLVVANLSDDNDDGVVDLCDTPDVAFVCRRDQTPHGVTLFVLDGETGTPLYEHSVADNAYGPTLAAADLDGDGQAELVLAHDISPGGPTRTIQAMEPDGTMLWETTVEIEDDGTGYPHAAELTIADLDGDGAPTILTHNHALNADGSVLWNAQGQGASRWGDSDPLAVDLDDDGLQEVIWQRLVLEHDGSTRFEIPVPDDWSIDNDFGQWDVAVADLDENGDAELIVRHDGVNIPTEGLQWGSAVVVVSASGDIIESTAVGTEDNHFYGWWGNGSGGLAIHDVDGDGDQEAVVASGFLGVSVVDISAGGELTETSFVDHPEAAAYYDSGWEHSSGEVTAFDFLQTGESMLISSGAGGLAIYDLAGSLLFEHSVSWDDDDWYDDDGAVAIADVDNDGSAEVIARLGHTDGASNQPVRIVVLEDPNDGWAPARRIWNQTQYNVSHVREDGQVVRGTPSWRSHNTHRVQTTTCDPAPEPPG